MNGSDARLPWWRRLFSPTAGPPPARVSTPLGGVAATAPLASMLAPDGLVTWDAPTTRDEAVRTLLARVVPEVPGLTAAAALRLLHERDALGPTAIGEGVDLPHARIDGVARPVFAIGRSRAGLTDWPPPEAPQGEIEVVWLLLLPPGGAGLGPTAQVARACRDRAFRAALRAAASADDVRAALARWALAQAPPSAPWST